MLTMSEYIKDITDLCHKIVKKSHYVNRKSKDKKTIKNQQTLTLQKQEAINFLYFCLKNVLHD